MGIPASALVLLDAVPWTRTLARAAGLGPLFAVNLRAEPSACNAFGSNLGLLDAVSFPVDDVRLAGTNHCDPENPSDVPLRAGLRRGHPARHRPLPGAALPLPARRAPGPAVVAGPGFRRGSRRSRRRARW